MFLPAALSTCFALHVDIATVFLHPTFVTYVDWIAQQNVGEEDKHVHYML